MAVTCIYIYIYLCVFIYTYLCLFIYTDTVVLYFNGFDFFSSSASFISLVYGLSVSANEPNRIQTNYCYFSSLFFFFYFNFFIFMITCCKHNYDQCGYSSNASRLLYNLHKVLIGNTQKNMVHEEQHFSIFRV